jgi:hypothetical protein
LGYVSVHEVSGGEGVRARVETMKYDKTIDCFISCNFLATKTSRIHLVYTQPADLGKDECHSATANMIKESSTPVDLGFEYVAPTTI